MTQLHLKKVKHSGARLKKVKGQIPITHNKHLKLKIKTFEAADIDHGICEVNNIIMIHILCVLMETHRPNTQNNEERNRTKYLGML